MIEKIEIWKDIPEYEGLYQVSNLGKVKSLERVVRCGKGTKILKERILKSGKNSKNYLSVVLCKNGKMKCFTVHKLVCLVFIPNDNPTEKTEINHIDENKENNHVSNLEWVTPKENCNYATRNERIGKAHKSKPRPKLHKSIIQLDLQNNFIRVWDSATQVEKELNIYATSITACCKGRLKTAYGYLWKYKENNTNLVIS